MLYQLYELGQAALGPMRAAANATQYVAGNPFNPLAHTNPVKKTAAAAELLERTTRRYKKPAFRIAGTMVNGRPVAVTEEIVWKKPFCRLLHFKKQTPPGTDANFPHVLIVAPVSGHFATLLRGTVEAMLPYADVYITEWADARTVPLRDGNFNLDDYIDYVIDMIELFKGDVHVMGVCQPAIPVLAAVALMETRQNPHVPRSVILKGGPVDTRINPTAVNKLAEEKGTNWFRKTVISSVPWPNAGHGRLVYPGFLQLTGFMAMNLDKHVKAHRDLFDHLVEGDGDSVEKHKEFYDEYLAVMDLTAEYYLQTIDQVFVKHQLPKGEMFYRERELIDLTAVTRVAMMTVEGEKDDITGLGQCEAALHLCTNLARSKKRHYVQLGVGHYGIFNGSKFRHEIVPRVVSFIAEHDGGSAVREIVLPVRVEAIPHDDQANAGSDDENVEADAVRLSTLAARPSLKKPKTRSLAHLSAGPGRFAGPKYRRR